MNSDEFTETFIAGNISGFNVIRKNLTRDIPTTSTSYAVDIGSWSLSNGTAYFEFNIQVNASGFTVHKYYKFSVISNATGGAWHVVSPEVDSGASATNNFALEINSNGSIVSFRLHRTGGSTAGEAKVLITKVGSNDDVFTSSSTSSNVGAVSGTTYSRSYGVNYVLLTDSNTFTSDQTVNARFTAKGDGTNYPAVRLGAGAANLSNNGTSDGSVIVQGTTAKGLKSQFEIIAPNSGTRLGFEVDNSNGPIIFGQNSHIKINQNSGSLVIAGTNATNGLLFSTGVTSGINADGGITRLSSGNLRITNGGSSLGSLSVSKLRINSSDTTKANDLYISGSSVYLEGLNTNPAYITTRYNNAVGALTSTSSGVSIAFDSTGHFSILSQTNAQIKSMPGSGTSTARLFISSNGNVGIGMTNPAHMLHVTGSFRAASLYGDGTNITSLSSSNLLGTIPSGLLPYPGTGSLGGIKRNVGSLGNVVTGVSTDGSLLYGAGYAQNTPTKTVAIFKPLDVETLSSGTMATSTTRNNRPILQFNSSTGTYAAWTHILPEGTYLSGGLTCSVWWSADVTLGTVGWEIAFERLNDGSSIASNSFGTPQLISASTVPASGLVKKTSVTFTSGQIGGLLAGEMFRTRIKRDVDNDTAAGFAELHQIEIRAAY
jgi:hypothetical protein